MGLCYLPPERVKMVCCCLPPDRVKLTVNSKQQGQNDPSVKMGWCHLPPERVKLKVNTKKESGWAAVVYPLKESN